MAKPGSNTITGRLTCHPDGYGFVIPDDPTAGGDVFIPPKKMRNATHGDQVAVRLIDGNAKRGGRRTRSSLEGEIVKVLSRAREVLVGKVFHYQDEPYLAPLDPRYHYTIRLVDETAEDLPDGRVVAAGILVQPGKHETPLGEVVEVLGDPGDPDIQYKIVCYTYGIPLEFPERALRQAESAPEIGPDDLDHRRDLRDEPTVTIDGEPASDFDDAVSIEQLPDGSFNLKVHIADVSHYVTQDSPLDTEAFVRGTSVYFPDRAIPMLPPRLSNGLCSLNPGVDRLAVTVEMEVDRKGNVRHADFYESVINSNERMTYTAVKQILIDKDRKLTRRYKDLLERFRWMLELCEILHNRRVQAGAIDLDLPEAEIEYSEGEVLDIVRSERNQAHRIIEEFMLLANQTVAEYLERREVPLVYRIHEEPDALKVEEFREIAARFGYTLETRRLGTYSAKSFQALIDKLSGQKESQFLSYLMLRSFKQARYSQINRGHFGLAVDTYTHFTSPIRRYPDLIVHRILKTLLAGRHESPEAQSLYERLDDIAEQSSERERKSVEAERDVMKWIMARFMSQRLGEEYEGFIIGMRHNGFFVELIDHFVEGFVPVETIWDDFYVFNERGHCFIGESNHRVFRIGDQVRVRVDKVNLDRHLIDFSPVLPPIQGPKGRRKSRLPRPR
ncbi:MAG: ribonuclease R [Acidobacteria bacterium]|nr:MAG: ribonuclease R [Acidobacteriota bacterium]